MCASVVSSVDATPVLEAREHVLDPMAFSVEDAIVFVLCAMLGMGRNARGDAPLGQSLSESRGTVGPVGEQEAGGRQMGDDSGSGLMIVGLAFAQMQQQWASAAVTDHLQLAGQAAPGASDTSG